MRAYANYSKQLTSLFILGFILFAVSPVEASPRKCAKQTSLAGRILTWGFVTVATGMWVVGVTLDDPTPLRTTNVAEAYPDDSPFLLHPHRTAEFFTNNSPGEVQIEGLGVRLASFESAQLPKIVIAAESHICEQCIGRKLDLINQARHADRILMMEGDVYSHNPTLPHSEIYGVEAQGPALLLRAINGLYELQTLRRTGVIERLDLQQVALLLSRSLEDMNSEPLVTGAWKSKAFPRLKEQWKDKPEQLRFLNFVNDSFVGGSALQSARMFVENMDYIIANIRNLITIRKEIAMAVVETFDESPSLSDQVGSDDLARARSLSSQGRDITPDEMARFSAGLNFEERELAMVRSILDLYDRKLSEGKDITVVVGAEHAARIVRALRASLEQSGADSVAVQIDTSFIEHDDFNTVEDPFFDQMAQEIQALSSP